MKYIEVKNERQRTMYYTASTEIPRESNKQGLNEPDVSHSYSSAYYSALMGDDQDCALKILEGETDLEWKILEDCRK